MHVLVCSDLGPWARGALRGRGPVELKRKKGEWGGGWSNLGGPVSPEPSRPELCSGVSFESLV